MTSKNDNLATILATLNDLKVAVDKQSDEIVELKAKLTTVADNVQALPASHAISSASLLDEIEKKFAGLSGKITKSTKAISSSVAEQIGDSTPREFTQTEIKRFLTDSLKVNGDTDLKKALREAVPFFKDCEAMDDVINTTSLYRKAQKMTKFIYERGTKEKKLAEINKIIMEVRSAHIKNSGEKARVLVPEAETKEEKDAKKLA